MIRSLIRSCPCRIPRVLFTRRRPPSPVAPPVDHRSFSRVRAQTPTRRAPGPPSQYPTWQFDSTVRAFPSPRSFSSTCAPRQLTVPVEAPEKIRGEAETEAATIPSLAARPFKLRPYQIDCINTILDTLSTTELSRLGISSPTGSGKTAMFTELIPRLPARIHPDTAQLANRVLILVGTIQLAKQAAEVVKTTYPALHVEVEQGDNDASGFADVTVATFQASHSRFDGRTLARSDLARLDKFDPSTFKAVIVDEVRTRKRLPTSSGSILTPTCGPLQAHHAASQSYINILCRFDPRISETSETSAVIIEDDVLAASPVLSFSAESTQPDPPHLPPKPFCLSASGELCIPILAFTATFSRADGLALGKVVQKIVWHASWLDMITKGWLCDIRFTTVRLGSALDLNSIGTSKTSGDFIMASLARAVDQAPINRICVESWKEKAEQTRRSTLVFAVDVNHVVSLTNAFREQGIDARFVHQGIKIREREQIYDAFRNGEFQVLVNCSILTEGADFPFIDCVLLARPTKSRNLFQQMIGRGMRKSPLTGKTDCLIIDFVGNSTEGIVCTPTLFGIDPNLAIEARSTKDLQNLAITSPAPEPRALILPYIDADPSRLAYEEFNTVTEFLTSRTKASTTKHSESSRIPLSRLTRNSWIGVGQGAYVLELGGKGYIRISPKDDAPTSIPQWEAKGYRRIPQLAFTRNPYAKPTVLGTHPDIRHLLATIDALVANVDLWKPTISTRRFAPWREHPSTPSQQTMLSNKLKNEIQDGRIEGLWVPGREREGGWVKVEELNKGEACDLITRVMHGGIGALRKVKKEVEKARKSLIKQGSKSASS
ncbi:BZ3500_MvSof-1268-A1-R1_Chr1-2g01439 [Microbotryum saponariae]|uniref:BZ3500_MvSof-1268-A1-R1_Chr1-2g01439 protein n=1 Tax=Microbotryum saponariae TaxID=289078 RepID=A0A2X0L6S1_9BASI|nr:BZ3500_MvSof-1268-A1-R1_Chr1-2g01439 [Microbotryum saponariae]SCZ97439.1 BZ3501_MvSof-1269-A2-R1_Chr1-2g01038 [Microbotryum saponariae]